MHISSRENPAVKEIVKLRESARERRERGLFVCEGEVMLREALDSGLVPRAVYALEGGEPDAPCEIHTVTQSVLDKMSGTVTARGPVFTLETFERQPPPGGMIIALDGVQDPGNAGTIVRCAESFGASVALMDGCADIFAPKVVRAAMGSLFRVNFFRARAGELAEICRSRGSQIYTAELAPESLQVTRVPLKNACVIIGNESRGVSEQSKRIASQSVIIPISGAQSLNAAVAAAIFMWEGAR